VPVQKFDREKLAPVMESIPETQDTINKYFPSGIPYIDLSYPGIIITGGTLSGPVPFSPYTIFRSEIAYVKDNPVFVAKSNIPLLRPLIELPDEKINDYSSQLNALLGQKALLEDGEEGRLSFSDIVRWSIGIDHNQWIRFLNPRQTVFISFQLFGEHYLRLPLDATYSIQERVDSRDVYVPGIGMENISKPYFVKLKPNNYKATLMIRTGYPIYAGYLSPEIVSAFEFGDFDNVTYLLQPSLNYYFEPFRVRVEYNLISGIYSGIGFYRDRDNILIRFEYVL